MRPVALQISLLRGAPRQHQLHLLHRQIGRRIAAIEFRPRHRVRVAAERDHAASADCLRDAGSRPILCACWQNRRRHKITKTGRKSLRMRKSGWPELLDHPESTCSERRVYPL